MKAALGLVESSRWVFVGTVLGKPLQFATNVLLARILGPAGFGLLGLANTTALVLATVSSLGLTDATSKFVAEYLRNDPAKSKSFARAAFWTLACLSVLFAVVAWFGRGWWARNVFPPGTSSTVLMLALAVGVCNVLGAVLTCTLTGAQLFKEVTLFGLVQTLMLLLTACALGLAFGPAGALLGYVTAGIASMIWAATRVIRIRFDILSIPREGDFRKIIPMLHFGLPSWIAGFVVHPLFLMATSALALQANGAHELGVFNAANGLKMLVGVLPGVVSAVIGPAIFEAAGVHGDESRCRHLIDDSVAALLFVSIPVSICLMFMSDLIFMIYGTAFAGASSLFLPLTAGIGIGVMAAPYQFLLVARGHTWLIFWLIALRQIVFVALAAWWTPAVAGAGLAWASFAADMALALALPCACAALRILQLRTCRVFALAVLAQSSALLIAKFAPPEVLWLLAFPLGAVTALWILKLHTAVAGWIVRGVPGRWKDAAQNALTRLERFSL